MTKITESEIETFAIKLFERLRYQYIYAPSIAPDSDTPERERFEDVILIDRLRNAVSRINPNVPADVREVAVKQNLRLNSPELIANNEAFHRLLTEGNTVNYQDRAQQAWIQMLQNVGKRFPGNWVTKNNAFIVSAGAMVV